MRRNRRRLGLLAGRRPDDPPLYHSRYNVTAFGLERRHPFDGRKYRRIHDALIARRLRRPGDFTRPPSAGRELLRKIHSEDYLKTLREPKRLAEILEVPVVQRLPSWLIDWRILKPMRFATAGTVLSCRLALKHGIAINLGGGFHHAASDWGGGFCVYADVPLAVKILHDEGKVHRVLVVDLDAHQGNGTAAIFRGWPWARIFDLYEEDIFPFRKEREDCPLPVPRGLTGGNTSTSSAIRCPRPSTSSVPTWSSTTPAPTRSPEIPSPIFVSAPER